MARLRAKTADYEGSFRGGESASSFRYNPDAQYIPLSNSRAALSAASGSVGRASTRTGIKSRHLKRSEREAASDLVALERLEDPRNREGWRSVELLPPSRRGLWLSKPFPVAKDGTKYGPSKRLQDRGWNVPCPPYAIDLEDPDSVKNPLVEAIMASTMPRPHTREYGSGGRPLLFALEKPHAAQTNNGFARNTLGGFFTK